MLWWFAETTLVAGLLAAAAALAGRLRVLGAPARHLLWVLVLIKLVAPPVVRSPWAVPLPLAETAEDRHPASPVAEAPARIVAVPEPDPAEGRDGPPKAAVRPLVLEANEATARPIARDPAAASFREFAVGESWKSFRREAAGATAPARAPALVAAAATSSWLPATARWLLLGWGAGVAFLAAVQARRVLAFRSRIREAVPAPEWLVAEVERLGEALRVRPPEVLVAAGIGTPLLWCLGRPKLLIPFHLIRSLDADRWRGVLAHELAHLRRGDHWVSRLELAAGLLWWWNPLYWIARRRIDAEAELACDAWVVSTLPRDRHAYAEVLLHICSELSPQRPSRMPAPALGVAGSGRFLERRLLMVLNAHRDETTACRITPAPLAAACLLGLLALPSWSLAKPADQIPASASASASVEEDADADASVTVTEDMDVDASITVADDDDDDDDDDDKPVAKEKHKAKAAARAEKHKKAEAKESGEDDGDDAGEAIAAEVEKAVEEALGPDFEKDMEAWGEKFGKEMEEKFGDGSEFQKKMEAFGKEMQEKFGEGSEFQKKMEDFGKEMEKKFGDGSEFQKKMEAFGKEMEKKFGEGSEFQKQMEKKFGEGSELQKKMEQKFGPGSDFDKKMKEKAEAFSKKAQEQANLAQKKIAEAKIKADEALRHKAEADKRKAEADKHKVEADKHKVEADKRKAEVLKHKVEAEQKAEVLKHKVEAEGKSAERPDREKRIKDLESKVGELLKEIKSLKDAD